MAASKKLLNCLKNSAPNYGDNFPAAVKRAAENKSVQNQALMTAALNQHKAKLHASLKQIENHHKRAQDKIISESSAKIYTKQAHDPTNELGTFEPRSVGSVIKNLVMRAGGFVSKALKFDAFTAEQRDVLNHFDRSFNQEMGSTIEKLFNPKDGSSFPSRYEDMMQYLVRRLPSDLPADKRIYANLIRQPYTYVDGNGNTITSKLDPLVKAAIAATAYEWIGNEATRKALGQDQVSMRSLLGLEKDEPIPDEAWEALALTGVHTDTLEKALGRTILQRLAITDTSESAANAKNRLELSLGQMALAAMEEMDLVTRQEVYSDVLDGLSRGELPDDGEIFYKPNFDANGVDQNSRKDRPTMKMTMLRYDHLTENDQPIPLKKITVIEELMTAAPDTFDQLFDNNPCIRGLSWGRIKLPIPMSIGRTKEKANNLQAKNVQKYTDIKWAPMEHSLGAFEKMIALGDTDPEAKQAMDLILGKEAILTDANGRVTLPGKLNLRVESVKGINRSIDKDVKNVLQWLKQSQATGNSVFRLPSVFMSNMRMLMRGDINPQNSKLHRNLFRPEGWNVQFIPEKQPEILQAFKEAVAQALDIESGKEGGVGPQMAKLTEKLSNPLIANAVNALRQYDTTGVMTTDLLQRIALGVKETDNKLHGFKGLQEWARYLNHTTGSFTTDIYKEIDGVSNGPIIGTMMLISNSANKQNILATLAMGGMNVGRQEVNLDEKIGKTSLNLNDAYQRMGLLWAQRIGELKKEWYGLGKDGRQELDWADAIGAIIGRFQDDNGVINSIIRNLSKPRTMQTTYGASIYRQSQLLATTDIIDKGIYAAFEQIIADLTETPDDPAIEQRLEVLLINVSTLTGTARKSVNYYKVNGKLDIGRVSSFKLTPAEIKQVKHAVNQTYGRAMGEAIEEVYQPLIEARKPFLTAIQLSITMYNKVLETRVNSLIQAKLDSRLAEVQNPAYEQSYRYKTTKQVTVGDLENAAIIAKDENKKSEHKAANQLIKDFLAASRITNQELDTILTELEPLLPRIKTPLHTEEDSSYLALYTVGKTKQRVQSDLVEQIYATNLARQRGYATSIPYMDPAGAAPMVKAIQMIDSMIANHLMGLDTPILNNHDGFSHAIGASGIIAKEANKRFFEIMRDYSLGDEISKMFNGNLTTALQLFKTTGISSEDVFNAMLDDGSLTVDMAAELMGVEKGEITEGVYEYIKDNPGKNARKIAIRNAIEEAITDYDRGKLFDDLSRSIRRKVENMGKEVTDNKNEVIAALTEVAQYPNNGKGYSGMAPTSASSKIFGDISRDKVLAVDAANTDERMETMAQLVADGFGSSIDNVSTTASDYANSLLPGDASKITSLNVSQIFDQMADLDEKADLGSVPIPTEHKSHLKRILNDVVAKVMDPVQLYIAEHKLDKETNGLYTVDKKTGNKIWIQTQKVSNSPRPGMLGQGIRMSAAEAYAHELVHHITHFGLEKSPHLKKQADDLYDFAYRAFTTVYGDTAFRVFMNDSNADINDPANAYEVQAAKERWDYIFNPTKNADNGNNGTDEFLAFGLTNANFKRELGYLTINAAPANKAFLGIFENNIQQSIQNLFNKIMDFIHDNFFKQQHSSKVDAELENLVIALAAVNSRAQTTVYRSFVSASNTVVATSVQIDEKIKNIATKAMSKSHLSHLIYNLNKIPDADNIVSHKMRLLLKWYGDKGQGLAASLATEMKGTTERMKPLHNLLTRRNRAIDAAKADAAKTIMAVVNDLFKDPNDPLYKLKSAQKVAITKALMKTDLSSLVHKASPRAIMGYLDGEQQREARIRTLAQQMANDPELAPYRHFFEKAADDLGYFMVTSDRRPDGVPMMNAHNIARMKQTKHADALGDIAFQRAVNLIDEMATLSALRYVRVDQKRQLLDLMNKDWVPIEGLMLQHNQLKENALQTSFNGSPTLMTKGYTKQITNPRIQFQQGTLADRMKYERAGYTMMPTPTKRDPNDPISEDIYLFKSNLGTVNDLQPGIASFTQNSGRGETFYTIYKEQLGNANPITAADVANKRVTAALEKTLDGMFLPVPRVPYTRTGRHSYMIPKFDTNGNITEMRYMMNEHMKDTVLEQFSEVDAVMASMTSQIIDKDQTPVINKELIVALKDLYDKEYDKFSANYVEISPFSKNPDHRAIYHMLPPATKTQLESIWGSKRMMVSRDVLTLAFGQRKYSAIEMYAKNPATQNRFEKVLTEVLIFALGWDNPFSDSGLHDEKGNTAEEQRAKRMGRTAIRTKRIEEFLTQTTTLAKSNIVIRNLGVTHGNYLSNMAYLSSKGVPPHNIMKHSREAINSALAYQVVNKELQELKVKRTIILNTATLSQADKDVKLNKMDRRILRLEDVLTKNPSTAMIRAGLMPQVVDDVNTAVMQTPYKYGIDAALDKGLSKLPTKIEAATRTLFMTTDTEGYRMLNNAVKMTDYVSRFVLYQHYTSKGMEHPDALSAVTDEFINFDLPTHKSLEYLNSVGILWFSKYQLRVLKHIKNLVADSPFTTLATFILGSYIAGNNNIINSIPGITKGLDQGIADPISMFAGSGSGIFNIEAINFVGSTFD